jgi:hypothetical protein
MRCDMSNNYSGMNAQQQQQQHTLQELHCKILAYYNPFVFPLSNTLNKTLANEKSPARMLQRQSMHLLDPEMR